MGYTDTDKLAINTIRVLAVSTPQQRSPAPAMSASAPPYQGESWRREGEEERMLTK